MLSCLLESIMAKVKKKSKQSKNSKVSIVKSRPEPEARITKSLERINAPVVAPKKRSLWDRLWGR